MIAARARVPSTCMIWQVVLGTGTCKSINLDLARAARYRYFTKNRPAHADQNSDQSNPLLAVNLPAVRVGHGVGPGWERSHRAGLLVADRHHTRSHRHATHTLTLTHSLHTTSSSRFIHTLPAQSLNVTWHSQPSSILGKCVCLCESVVLTCFVCLCLCCCDRLTLHTQEEA